MKNNTDNTFELIGMIFKALDEGRVDKEEALLILQLLFSEKIDEEDKKFIKYICLFRPIESISGSEPLQVSPRGHYYS